MPSGFYVWFIFVIAFVVAAALLSAPMDAKTGFFGLDLRKVDLAWLRDIGFFLAGAGIAPLGLWLAHQRTASLSGQTENETARRITDAFTKAVELLGHESIAVRQGGIYALGRLAFENTEERPKIMDIIAAFVRQRSAERYNERVREIRMRVAGPDLKHALPDFTASFKDKAQALDSLSKESMPIDLDAAISIIGDLNPARSRIQIKETRKERKKLLDQFVKWDPHVLDLSNAFLFNADFSHVFLSGSNLSDSRFLGCVFAHSNVKNANMAKSDFTGSDLRGADFSDADMHSAIFKGANMHGVTAKNVVITDSNFTDSDLRCADFSGTDMYQATFVGADIRGADFRKSRNLSGWQLTSAHGDMKTQLPHGFEHPGIWAGPEQ